MVSSTTLSSAQLNVLIIGAGVAGLAALRKAERKIQDWIPWSEYIFTLADEYRVKGYIDPDILSPGFPTEPIRPSPTIIRPTTIIPATEPDQVDSIRTTLFSDLTQTNVSNCVGRTLNMTIINRFSVNILKL